MSWEPWTDGKLVLPILARPLNARRKGLTYWVSRRVLLATTEELVAVYGVMAAAGWCERLGARFIVNNELDHDDVVLPRRLIDLERFAHARCSWNPVARVLAGHASDVLDGHGNQRASGICWALWLNASGPTWPLAYVKAAR